MTNYENLVKALRCKRDDCEGCDLAFLDNDEGWMCQYAAKDDDAADAIEALDRLLDQNTERCEALRKQLREAHESYEKHLNELESQLPKRGEWIHNTAVYGTTTGGLTVEHHYTCSVCGGLMGRKGDKFCYKCGAKMEVQDESVF